MLVKQNEDCNKDSTGRREPFKRVLEIIKTRARRLRKSFGVLLDSALELAIRALAPNILKTVGLKSVKS